MKRTAIVTTFAAVALAALTACSNSDSDDAKPASTPSPSASASAANDAARSAGIPPKPTGQARADLLAALRAINPELVADEDDAIDNSRNQCSSVNGKSPKADSTAQQRFSSGSYEVSSTEATAINAALAAFCATA